MLIVCERIQPQSVFFGHRGILEHIQHMRALNTIAKSSHQPKLGGNMPRDITVVTSAEKDRTPQRTYGFFSQLRGGSESIRGDF
jgi:hypothetical protein